MAELPLTPSTLPQDRRQAGADYLSALKANGFVPEGLSWAVDESDRFHLVMVTSLVDRLGPSAIYDMLFKAYEKAVTPKSVDPWIVTLFSPDSVWGKEFLKSAVMDIKARFEIPHDEPEIERIRVELTIQPFRMRPDWIYVRGGKKQPSAEQLRHWHRFARNVEARAA